MKDIDGLMGSYKKKRKDLWLHFWCSPQCFCCCAFSYNPSCLHLPPITCFIVVLTIVTAQIKQHSKWNIANPMISVFVLFIFVRSQIVSSASKSGWDFFYCHASLSDRQKNSSVVITREILTPRVLFFTANPGCNGVAILLWNTRVLFRFCNRSWF